MPSKKVERVKLSVRLPKNLAEEAHALISGINATTHAYTSMNALITTAISKYVESHILMNPMRRNWVRFGDGAFSKSTYPIGGGPACYGQDVIDITEGAEASQELQGGEGVVEAEEEGGAAS